MTVRDRLLKYLVYLDIGQNAFEKRAEISNGYIAHLKKSIGSDILNRISIAYPELNTDWLLTGKGHMLKPPKNDFSQITENELGEAIQSKIDEVIDNVFKPMIAEKDKKIADLEIQNKLLLQQLEVLLKEK